MARERNDRAAGGDAVNRHEAKRLMTALTGGLSVDARHDTGCSIEAAMAHIAAAQLRAIRFAMVMGEPNDMHHEEDRGWCTTGTFTRMDAVTAIGGVMALLQDSHYLADDIRRALQTPEAMEVEAAQ